MKYKKGRGFAMCSICGWDYLHKNDGALKIFTTDGGKKKSLCTDCYEVYQTELFRKVRKLSRRKKEACLVY